MTLNLSEHVQSGEIINTRKNSVHGYLTLREFDRPLVLQLTGNCSADLAGLHIRFEAYSMPPADSPPLTEDQANELRLAWMQVGVPGKMTANHLASGLYLEWYGQNGHTIVEVKDAIIVHVEDGDEVDEDDLPTEDELDEVDADGELENLREHLRDLENLRDDDEPFEPGSQGVSFEPTDDADVEPWYRGPIDDGDDEDDPFGLFPPDLDASLGAASLPWNVELDEATLAQWKEWDEVFDGDKDVPLSSLFDPPIQLPPESALDDEQVARLFNTILMQLALHNVAFHMCEHFTPRTGYSLLVDQILREHGTHPELPRIGYTMNFDSSEYCAECAAEFKHHYGEQTDGLSPDSTDFDPLNDGDVPF